MTVIPERDNPGWGELRHVPRHLFRYISLGERLYQQIRLSMCPFKLLVDAIPPGSTILDVGCGSGLFLSLLAYSGRISSGRGFDASYHAVSLAQKMLRALPSDPPLIVEHRTAAQPWPDNTFDVVSVVDVLHHIPSSHQKEVLLQAASRVSPGGILLYKDMVTRPAWRAWANVLHDLVISRVWISHAKLSSVAQWASEGGLVQVRYNRVNRFCYGHEIVLFAKPPIQVKNG